MVAKKGYGPTVTGKAGADEYARAIGVLADVRGKVARIA